jgi:hypothetical protein
MKFDEFRRGERFIVQEWVRHIYCTGVKVMIEQVERVLNIIIILEILLILLLTFLSLSGFINNPVLSVSIGGTTPHTITGTVTATPTPTPVPTPVLTPVPTQTGWHYDPETGYYVK